MDIQAKLWLSIIEDNAIQWIFKAKLLLSIIEDNVIQWILKAKLWLRIIGVMPYNGYSKPNCG